ncbi:hypothetical protein D3C80_1923400 [compost metagenome]
MAGERLEIWPTLDFEAAQVDLDPRRMAARITVTHQDVGRRAGEEALELALAAA